MNGKGSKQRPLSVSKDKFDSNWDSIFGKKLETKVRKETPKHGLTSVHLDKTKYNRNKIKQELLTPDLH
jgi:hypothetical protein